MKIWDRGKLYYPRRETLKKKEGWRGQKKEALNPIEASLRTKKEK